VPELSLKEIWKRMMAMAMTEHFVECAIGVYV
jgi:hypothetical protein